MNHKQVFGNMKQKSNITCQFDNPYGDQIIVTFNKDTGECTVQHSQYQDTMKVEIFRKKIIIVFQEPLNPQKTIPSKKLFEEFYGKLSQAEYQYVANSPILDKCDREIIYAYFKSMKEANDQYQRT